MHPEYAVVSVADPLQPLRRLQQLTSEIQTGLALDDIELVCRAAALLEPALEEWQEVRITLPEHAGEANRVAQEVRRSLDECETLLLEGMERVAQEITRLRTGQRELALARGRYPAAVCGGLLDTSR